MSSRNSEEENILPVEPSDEANNNEKEACDEVTKKLEHVRFSKIVRLNVGGHFFSTNLATLNKDPGSMLHAMFSRRFDTKPSEDGSYFIDRDGTHFRYILNYLRTGQLIVPKDEMVRIREELLAEAEFYQVEGIISELTARPFKNSVILSSDQRETLMNWLKETQALNNTRDNLFFALLYRASRDGWAAADFHARCDYKGPTVTVIKSGEYIFGGYTEQQWEHTGKHFNPAYLI